MIKEIFKYGVYMRVFLLMRDNDVRPEDFLLIGRQEDAERLVKDGYGLYYEPIEVLSGSDVENFYKNGLIGRG